MPNKPAKRVLSAKARKAISEAQKARWAKAKNKLQVYIPKSKRDIFSFLNDRTKIYSSTMEAYVDGYLDGFNDR